MAMSAYYLKGVSPPSRAADADLQRLHAVPLHRAGDDADRVHLPRHRDVAAQRALRALARAVDVMDVSRPELPVGQRRGARRRRRRAERRAAGRRPAWRASARSSRRCRPGSTSTTAHALAQARARDLDRAEGRPLGPLHGVPVGIKDIIDTTDMPTEDGTVLHAGRRPARDAAVVAQLRAAGAVILGKTVTTECATYPPGKTRNPHDADAHARRLVGGVGGGGGRRHGAARDRHADQRRRSSGRRRSAVSTASSRRTD